MPSSPSHSSNQIFLSQGASLFQVINGFENDFFLFCQKFPVGKHHVKFYRGVCTSGQGLCLPQIRPQNSRKGIYANPGPLRGPLPVLSEPEPWSKRESQCIKGTIWGTSLLPILCTSPTLVLGIPKLLIPWAKAFLKAPIIMQILEGRNVFCF